MTKEELLEAIKEGRAQTGYNPDGRYAQVDGKEIPMSLVYDLVGDGHRIKKNIVMHLNHGGGKGSALYNLSLNGDE